MRATWSVVVVLGLAACDSAKPAEGGTDGGEGSSSSGGASEGSSESSGSDGEESESGGESSGGSEPVWPPECLGLGDGDPARCAGAELLVMHNCAAGTQHHIEDVAATLALRSVDGLSYTDVVAADAPCEYVHFQAENSDSWLPVARLTVGADDVELDDGSSLRPWLEYRYVFEGDDRAAWHCIDRLWIDEPPYLGLELGEIAFGVRMETLRTPVQCQDISTCGVVHDRLPHDGEITSGCCLESGTPSGIAEGWITTPCEGE